jgi:hypothetical protein
LTVDLTNFSPLYSNLTTLILSPLVILGRESLMGDPFSFFRISITFLIIYIDGWEYVIGFVFEYCKYHAGAEKEPKKGGLRKLRKI